MSGETLRVFIDRAVASNPIEARIIGKIVKAMANAGNPIVKTFDGEETSRVSSKQDVFDVAFNLDEVQLITKSGASIWLVMGEEWDILADYNTSLEDALKPVNEYIEAHW